jgi:Tfp pilus assembly protein PilN
MNVSPVITKLTTFASSSSTVVRQTLNPVWKILSISAADDAVYPANIVSASIDKGTLSVVYGARVLSQIKVKGIREYSFDEDRYPQPEVFASSLALAINDLGASKVDVSLTIPKAWAVIKTTMFPASVRENLSDVISYELDRITPFSPGDAFYDFKILAENAEKLTVLVAAAKVDMIQPYIDALGERGIPVSRLTVNLLGIETLCRYMKQQPDMIFAEMKKDGYEGALFTHGAVAGTFAGAYTSDDDLAKADALLKEIAHFADTMKEGGNSPQVLVLLKDKNSSLRETLRLRSNLQITLLNETDTRIKYTEPLKIVPYAAVGDVLGALWPAADALNLLRRGSHPKKTYPKVFTMLLVLLLLAMWILYLISPLRIEGKRLQEIDRQISLRKEEVRNIEALKKEVGSLAHNLATINDFKHNKVLALNILKELTVLLPKNAWLTRTRVTDKTVEIEGYSASATGLLPKLEASSYFKKAEFASPTFRDARMNADRFNIKMEIEGIRIDEMKKKEGGETTENEEE